jgi:hypothetical protein
MTPRTMRRVYLREAAVMLVLARLAVRFLPPAYVFSWADRPAKRVCRFAASDADWIGWAIEHAATRPGRNTLCLPRALAAHAMLRRRGIPSRLCLGVARNRDEVSAHAWVEAGEKKVVGGQEAQGFTRLAAFGGAT